MFKSCWGHIPFIRGRLLRYKRASLCGVIIITPPQSLACALHSAPSKRYVDQGMTGSERQ